MGFCAKFSKPCTMTDDCLLDFAQKRKRRKKSMHYFIRFNCVVNFHRPIPIQLRLAPMAFAPRTITDTSPLHMSVQSQ